MRTIEAQQYIVRKDGKGWEEWFDCYIINATDVTLAEALLYHIDGELSSLRKCRLRYKDDHNQCVELSGYSLEDREYLRSIC